MTVFEQLTAAGVDIGHHESDLYAAVTPESRAIVNAYEFRRNVRLFRDEGGRQWFDIPFAFDPFWAAMA